MFYFDLRLTVVPKKSLKGNRIKEYLESLIGISLIFDWQARLRLADVVEKDDVNEAMRLMEMSKDSLNARDTHARWERYQLIILFDNRYFDSTGHIIW